MSRDEGESAMRTGPGCSAGTGDHARRLRAALPAVALVAALTSCGAGAAAGSAGTTGRAGTPGPVVPVVTGTTVDGEQLDLAAHVRGGPAVLWFWAPWCPVCAAEADDVAAQAAASGDEVTFVGVGAHDDAEAVREFVDRHGLGGFEHLVDEDGAVWERFGISGQPAYAFISADGELRLVPSALGADGLAAEVDRLTGG